MDPKSAEYRHNFTSFRILIRLGDLARYQRDLTGLPEADWQAAWAYYIDALRLMPEQGVAYNQLAVLCTYFKDQIAALYYYARSLAVPIPSETGKSNIDVSMRTVSVSRYFDLHKKQVEQERGPKKARQIGDGLAAGTVKADPNPTNPMADLYNLFGIGFFALHRLTTDAELDLMKNGLDGLMAVFETLVTSDYAITRHSCIPRANGAGASPLIQLFTYNMFGIWNLTTSLSQQPPADAAAQAFQAKLLNLISQMSIYMLIFIIERAIADFLASPNTSVNPARPPFSPSSTGSNPALNSSSPSVHSASLCSTELLPAISIFLHWLACTNGRFVCFDLSNPIESAILTRFQRALVASMTFVLPASRRYQDVYVKYNLRGVAPLPEDLELFPFTPLAAAQADLNIHALTVLHDSDEAFTRRCFKIALFAQKVCEDALIVSSPAPVSDLVSFFLNPSANVSGAQIFNDAQAAEIRANLQQAPPAEDVARSLVLSNPASQQSSHRSPFHSQIVGPTSSGYKEGAADASSQSKLTSLAVLEGLADAFSADSSPSASLRQSQSVQAQPPHRELPQELSAQVSDFSLRVEEARRDTRPGAPLGATLPPVEPGPPRVLFSDSFSQDHFDNAQSLGPFAQGSPHPREAERMEGVTPTANPFSFGGAEITNNSMAITTPAPNDSAMDVRESNVEASYDPWGKFSDASSALAQTVTSAGAPYWNPFMAPANPLLHTQANMLGTSLYGQPQLVEQQRPLLFPASANPSAHP